MKQKKKETKETRGGKGERTRSRPPFPPGFPDVQPNSLPNYPRALVSERLEQARRGKQSFVHFQVHVFSSFADNTIHPSIYQSKWSGLSSRTRCPLQFAVTSPSLSQKNCVQHKPYQRRKKHTIMSKETNFVVTDS